LVGWKRILEAGARGESRIEQQSGKGENGFLAAARRSRVFPRSEKCLDQINTKIPVPVPLTEEKRVRARLVVG
jgi:hypothetical protein